MNKKQAKRQRDLKNKLMAAICMLLVSSIMMVSTTYAWFTLSTAPEVTGINTAVGANGNLEMALLPTDGSTATISTNVGDSTKALIERNVTWGNLVDLSASEYGLSKITLYPSQLTASSSDINGNPKTLKEAMLATPEYGADGRVSALVEHAVTSTYDSTAQNFPNNALYGVRAVGVASGMTDRQLAYRNARSDANTAMSMAKTSASQSLNNNGSSLANVALKKATNDNPTFNDADVNSLKAIVTDLVGTVTWDTEDPTKVASISKNSTLGYIEQAYIDYIYAYVISNSGVEDDANETKFKAIKAAAEADDVTLNSFVTFIGTYTTLDGTIMEPINALNGTILEVAKAQKELNALSGDGITWGQISVPLYKLADTDAMLIAGYPASQVKEHMSDIVNKVTNGGLTITIASGGGVYADIADHCGDYSASVTIDEVTYNSITLNDMNASMTTDSVLTTPYLVAFNAKVTEAGSPESTDGTVMPITDMYGYIIDMAFRTNAAESDLLLQKDGVDRIYDENSNEDTMGRGSSMTFKATTTDFSNDQVKELMKAIRIVFFQKDGNRDVVATAKLDVANATLGTDGWTAKIALYERTGAGVETYTAATYDPDATDTKYYTAEEETTTTYNATATTAESFATATNLYTRSGEEGNYTYTKVDPATDTYDAAATYYASVTTTETVYTEVTGTPADGTTVYTKSVSTAGENFKTDDVIMGLPQNTPVQLSMLVYLDGNNVGNEDVAATAATSVTGTMNLQFSSSASLVPMEYADLHTPGNDSDATTYTVTVDGTAETNGATAGENYEYTLPEGKTDVSKVTVGGADLTTDDYTVADGKLTIPAAKVTGNIAITTA